MNTNAVASIIHILFAVKSAPELAIIASVEIAIASVEIAIASVEVAIASVGVSVIVDITDSVMFVNS
jgi:hypothetical protein